MIGAPMVTGRVQSQNVKRTPRRVERGSCQEFVVLSPALQEYAYSGGTALVHGVPGTMGVIP